MPRHIDQLTLALLAQQHPTVGIFVEMYEPSSRRPSAFDRPPYVASVDNPRNARFSPGTRERGYGFVVCAQCAVGAIVEHGRLITMVREHDLLFAAWGAELDKPCMMCSTEMTTCPTLSSTS